MTKLSQLLTNVAFLGAVLLVLVIVGYVVIRMVRSRMRAADEVELFSLEDLRRLRASGQLSDAEYERMRAALIGRPATSRETRSHVDDDTSS